MSTCGEATARTIRSVIGWRSIRSLEWTLATTTSSCDEHLVVVVERAVLEDVDLDAGEDAERRHLLVEHRDIGELLLQPLSAQAVGDGEPGEWSVSTMYSWPRPLRGAGHRFDGRAAIAPPAVHVAVAAQCGAVAGAVVGQLDLRLGLDLVDVTGVAVAGSR